MSQVCQLYPFKREADNHDPGGRQTGTYDVLEQDL